MAKKSKIAKNEQRKEIVARYAERRAELKAIIKNPNTPDEARTFGMDSWFPTMKIWNPRGQNYVPVVSQARLVSKQVTRRGSAATATASGSCRPQPPRSGSMAA